MLLLDYEYDNNIINNEKQSTENQLTEKQNNELKVINFEEKYLEKFKKINNEYFFTEEEKKAEKVYYEEIKQTMINDSQKILDEIKDKIFIIEEILDNSNVDMNIKDVSNMSDFSKKGLIKYFDIYVDDDDSDYEIEEPNYLELYERILKEYEKIDKERFELENNPIDENDVKQKAYEKMLNNKLNGFINNYVLEYTPLGNVYLRYNNDKKSFEYFSNSTIPYRYLEPIGRKYVINYFCKPLFVDIEEELKKTEMKGNVSSLPIPIKKPSGPHTFDRQPTKNRNNTGTIALPNQVKEKISELKENNNEKHLLKENANRYTWKGRLSDFNPLKKVNRKIFDKKLEMSNADFKKLKNKK